MFVKPPRERLLMPQYHLADRSTQRKNKSMKWHPEKRRARKAPQSSIDWQDEERKWLILLYTSSIEVIHILSKSPRCLFDMQQECQTLLEDNVCVKEGRWPEQDEQPNWHHQKKKKKKSSTFITNVKPISRGWTTGQKTIKGYMWRRQSRATTATPRALYQVLPRN